MTINEPAAGGLVAMNKMLAARPDGLTLLLVGGRRTNAWGHWLGVLTVTASAVIGVLMLTVLNNGLLIAGVTNNIRSAVSGAVLIVAIVAAAWPYRSRLRIVK